MEQGNNTGTVVARLQSFHAADPEERLMDAFVRQIEDPLKPRTDNGCFRANPILLLLAAVAVVVGGTFLFFSLARL
jgi:hypothetical protein